ncbi:MAG: PD-(D/E)XK nuclease family protein [Bacteroidales bacterium]|nr:PD-(D/E)XK nuclease family protein [Bacteroidales bacterium]
MKSFLLQVASRYLSEGSISDICFIFPNRRSMAFFRKALSDSLQESAVSGGVSAAPFIAPAMLTINDFFYKVYDVDTTDRIRLLVELYACYREVFPEAEPLDEFIFWGDVILSDFDDIDKYLADPEHLFANVSDFKAIQDSYSYLTENQKNAVDRFLSHFRDGSGRLTVNMDTDGNVKVRFLRIWNVLYPLYRRFNAHLKERSMAYEGMVYRDLATRLKDIPVRDLLEPVFPGKEKFVFVGLNALNECEKVLMRKMRDAGVAEFCWDYVSRMIRHPLNKSSFFMEGNLSEFPQAFPVEAPESIPDIRVISVPSATGQVKLAPSILEEVRDGAPVETAFVLPDENLLLPLLNTIPEGIRDVNVTMGYPMGASALFSLMQDVISLQLRLRNRAGEWLFYHKDVHSIFSSGILRRIMTPEEQETVRKVREGSLYYIPGGDLGGGPLFELIFRPVVTDPRTPSREGIRSFADYLASIVSAVGSLLRVSDDMVLELDFAKRYYTALVQLKDIGLEILPQTFARLLERMLSGLSVPFSGEPLKGLQVMGPLETRALDFRNLIIFSANEGLFPRRSVSSSFIPPELRKGFGLPTYEYQDAVWAYYFYRMIQRAEKVWLVYDSRTEGIKGGEESRYIKQLEYHFRVPLKRFVAAAEMLPPRVESEIPKTEEDIRILKESALSASSLQNYLACPVRFYYQQVKGLKAEDEITESLDDRTLGNVFHKAMQAVYLGGEALREDFPMNDRAYIRQHVSAPLKEVTDAYIRSLLKDRPLLKRRIRSLIKEEMRSGEVTGRNLVIEEVLLEYVVKTLSRDLELMKKEGVGSFRIIGLEKYLEWEFGGFKFVGFVDRVDSFHEGEIRIVDYKTGRVTDKDINITDENAEAVADLLFGPDTQNRPKIALQLFLYDMYAAHDPQLKGNRQLNSIYSASRLFTREVENIPCSPKFASAVRERLQDTLRSLVDPNVPFRRTDDLKTCSYCDFKTICGR